MTGVLFDYGNTLITVTRPDQAIEAAYGEIVEHLRGAGHSPPEAAELIRHVHDRVEAEFIEHQRSGALEEMDLVAAASRAYADLGIRVDDETLDVLQAMEQRAWWEGVHVVAGAITALETLHAAGVRVGLCSNAPYRARSLHEQLDHLGLRSHLDAVTFSAQVGWRKPAPQIFEAALQALGTDAAHTVMVGDSLREDIDGARRAGMRAVLFTAHRSDGARPAAADAQLQRFADLSALLGVGIAE